MSVSFHFFKNSLCLCPASLSYHLSSRSDFCLSSSYPESWVFIADLVLQYQYLLSLLHYMVSQLTGYNPCCPVECIPDIVMCRGGGNSPHPPHPTPGVWWSHCATLSMLTGVALWGDHNGTWEINLTHCQLSPALLRDTRDSLAQVH